MILDHADACGAALLGAGLPCTEYHVWTTDDDLVHYWFGYERPLTDDEEITGQRVLHRFFGSD